ncbi:hypothetical protein HOLleu_00528 [Holothuria leucospilota]|uniref:Uncharacterized protein n=1 Tax=Holothuria leucospilota TaxID=206669 RepID=A0A9Q1CMW2_HOLLE|nr:hypothetical protein HOLleu_00528 [Holothuria leucospilota]
MALSKINKQQEETWTGLHRRLTSIDFDLGSVFCGQVASFIENSAKAISSCTGYALSCLLTTCGFISARKTLIKMPNGHTQNSNIFQLVVGPPSTGKSQALKKFALDPVKTLAEDLDIPDPIIHKSTLSGLTRKLSENKEGFFVSAEIFDSLSRLFKPDNDTNDSALLCELFSGEQVSFNYATKSTTNISSTIPFSILGCIQMFPMAKLFVLLNQGQGLLDRFLLNVPLCLRPTPQESHNAKQFLERLANCPDFDMIMSAINTILDSVNTFSFSEDAALFLEEMETEFITEMNEAIKNGTLPPKSKWT